MEPVTWGQNDNEDKALAAMSRRHMATGDASHFTVVREVFIVHVGGTRCVTFSTGNTMKIHARITLTVECIPNMYYFICIVCVNTRTSMINTHLFSMFDLPGHHRRRRCGRAATGYVHVGGTCNLEYRSKYTKTGSYNLGCWIDPSNVVHLFLWCLTNMTTTSLFFVDLQGGVTSHRCQRGCSNVWTCTTERKKFSTQAGNNSRQKHAGNNFTGLLRTKRNTKR